MRRFVSCICLLLVLGTLMAVPVRATTADNQRGSLFFLCYLNYLEKKTTNHFVIYYDVTGTDTMDELGVETIYLYRSLDQENWELACTYRSSIHTEMICKNTGSHVGTFTYCGTIGYYYQAKITMYAKDSRGTGYKTVYTNILQL